jgi:hypothetical protein
MTVILDRVPLEAVPTLWPHVLPHITRAIDAVTTSETPEGILSELLADRNGLWVIMEADSPLPFLGAAVTCMYPTNNGTVSEIRYLAGRQGGRWIRQCLREFEAISKASGADILHIRGRRAWRRYLPDYREVQTVIEKRL